MFCFVSRGAARSKVSFQQAACCWEPKQGLLGTVRGACHTEGAWAPAGAVRLCPSTRRKHIWAWPSGRPPRRQAPTSSCWVPALQRGRSPAQSQPPCAHSPQTHPTNSTGFRWRGWQEQSVLNAARSGLCDCRLAVDGPFGAALSDVFHYPVSVCIAAGIGVTPFAALLKSLWYRCCESQAQLTPSKVRRKIISAPVHGFKGSVSWYLSSADSWGGY